MIVSRARAALFFGVTCVVAASACLVTIDDGKVGGATSSDGGDASASDAIAATDGGVADATALDANDASTGCPAAMVAVPPTGKRLFCIDAFEVTVGAYKAFVDDAGPPELAALPVECRWKAFGSYVPGNWSTMPDPRMPVTAVDWCDAWAYCHHVGKRLCGAIGDGGAVEFYTDFTDAAADEWMNACSRGGARAYPYGSTYDGSACVGADNVPTPNGPLAPDPSRCIGGQDGIHDMSGNASEWTNSCDTARIPSLCDAAGPECDFCHVRGGSFFGTATTMHCVYSDNDARRKRLDELGFRCCAE